MAVNKKGPVKKAARKRHTTTTFKALDISKLGLGSYLKKIEESNKRFNKLDVEAQRIAVLKDALLLTKTKGYRVTQGSYGEFHGLYDDTIVKDGQFELLNPADFGVSCDVCAKGALFCSSVRLRDSAPENLRRGGIEEYDTYESLAGIFTQNELDVIEELFEAGEISSYLGYFSEDLRDLYNAWEEDHPDYDLEWPDGFDSTEFGAAFYPIGKRRYARDANQRLQTIIENILAENGDVYRGIMHPLLKLQAKKAAKTPVKRTKKK